MKPEEFAVKYLTAPDAKRYIENIIVYTKRRNSMRPITIPRLEIMGKEINTSTGYTYIDLFQWDSSKEGDMYWRSLAAKLQYLNPKTDTWRGRNDT